MVKIIIIIFGVIFQVIIIWSSLSLFSSWS
jgi:hypothetical protein